MNVKQKHWTEVYSGPSQHSASQQLEDLAIQRVAELENRQWRPQEWRRHLGNPHQLKDLLTSGVSELKNIIV